MQATVSLQRSIDFSMLQALLPTLLSVEACTLDTPSGELQLQFDAGEEQALQRDLSGALAAVGAALEWQPAAESADQVEPLYRLDAAVLTVIAPGDTLPVSELLPVFAEWGAQLLALRRLSAGLEGRPRALECYLGQADVSTIRPGLAAIADRWGVDLCIQAAAEKRPRRRLFVFDMDSTLIDCEVIDELAIRAGVGDEVAAVTARAMRGEIDFRSSFTERMAKLEGLERSALESVAATLPIMPGAARLLRYLGALGHRTAILSGGFDYFARRVQEQLGFDEIHANHLQISGGRLTGRVDGEIVDGERKVHLLRAIAEREGFAMADTVAVGDGANDLPMLNAAGIGVAFHAKPLVLQRARCAISRADLSALLYVIGVAEAR